MSKEPKSKEVKSKDTKNSKDKRHFFKDFRAELKRVIWPTPKQLVNNTVAVITIVLITTLIVFILDLAFETVNKYGINQLRTVVESSVKNEENNNTEGNTQNEQQAEANNQEQNTTVENVQE